MRLRVAAATLLADDISRCLRRAIGSGHGTARRHGVANMDSDLTGLLPSRSPTLSARAD